MATLYLKVKIAFFKNEMLSSQITLAGLLSNVSDTTGPILTKHGGMMNVVILGLENTTHIGLMVAL